MGSKSIYLDERPPTSCGHDVRVEGQFEVLEHAAALTLGVAGTLRAEVAFRGQIAVTP